MTMNDVVTMPSSLCWRRRFMVMVAFLALGLLASCSTEASDASGSGLSTEAPATAEPVNPTPSPQDAIADGDVPAEAAPDDPAAEQVEDPAVTPEPTPTPHPIALADTELPRAPIGFDELFDDKSGPQPVSIEIEAIGVRAAAVIPVGVNDDDLSFEVPPADQVGWYEFGPAPGEAGSAVLAAHIAYNGVDGVFRYLEDVEVGSVVVIGFDDGSTSRYRIEEVTEYVKEALPDSLFDREGDEQLALITCGGAFNYQLDSYESNTVAIAVPIDS